MKIYPWVNETYSFRNIVEDLVLPDLPFLLLSINDTEQVVQLSHFNYSELLKNEKWANSSWRYVRETSERIPIFKITPETESYLSDLVEWEEDTNYPYENIYCVSPKGYRREL
jgi:hypothetical protein